MKQALHVNELVLQVALGCEAEERAVRQEVRVSVEFQFPEPLQASFSDQLKDTVCYSDVCDALTRFVLDREFKLIEKLAMDLYGQVKMVLGDMPAQIRVKVHKIKPPVTNLRGGSIYVIGDF